ncbi:MAG: hypothetical protein KOO66_00940 [Bacteroidales bacterium]|nr:hypothetical protein [Bacteroidales bacterium]
MTYLKKTLAILFVFISVCGVFGQSYSQSVDSEDIFLKIQEKEVNQGDILIFQDMRINDLIYSHIEQNKRKEGVPGYRIRIYSDLGSSARGASQQTKAKFYGLFPEIPIYRGYVSPYYRVLVGDYRTRIDALKDFKRVKRYFPSAFIAPDKINYPKLEE